MKDFFSDFKELVKFRLTLTVVFSASVAFLIGSKLQDQFSLMNWIYLSIGGFLVTGAASAFNELIEVDIDKLMIRTAKRPLPAGRMATGKALVISLLMGSFGITILSKLNFVVALLSFFSIILYAVVYTPLKKKSPMAVLVGAIPGALPPLLGYFGSFGAAGFGMQVGDQAGFSLVTIPSILFLIQFVWQFPHFWAIAWFSDEDYRRGGIQLLPTTKKDKISALIIFLSSLLMIPVGFLPYYYGMGTWIFAVIALLGGAYFSFTAFRHFMLMSDLSAKKVMFTSLLYLPIIQLSLLLDFNLTI